MKVKFTSVYVHGLCQGVARSCQKYGGGGDPVRDLAVELLTLRHQDSSNFIMKHSTALAYKLRFYHSWLRPWTSVCVWMFVACLLTIQCRCDWLWLTNCSPAFSSQSLCYPHYFLYPESILVLSCLPWICPCLSHSKQLGYLSMTFSAY